MPAPATRPEPKRGDVHGCWTVLREAVERGRIGERRWWCRASCCGREVAKPLSDILRLPEAETCKSCRVWGSARGAQP